MSEENSKISYEDPDHRFRIDLINLPADESGHAPISMHLYFEAESIQLADDLRKEYAEEFLNALCFCTQTGFKIEKCRFIADWTPDLVMRDFFVFSEHRSDPQDKVLGQPHLDSIATLEALPVDPVKSIALHWFSQAMRSNSPEDQFQYFWYVVEIIATATKSTEKVSDKCQKCGSDLYCNTCSEISTHRPFGKQAIETRLRNYFNIKDNIIKNLFKVRNSLMHGATKTEIESELKKRVENFSFEKAVEIIGQIAWRMIFFLHSSDDPTLEVQVIQRSGFVQWRVRAVAHCQTVVPGANKKLEIENVVLPSVTWSPVDD